MRIFYAYSCGAFDVANGGQVCVLYLYFIIIKKDEINLKFVLTFQGAKRRNCNNNNDDDMVC